MKTKLILLFIILMSTKIADCQKKVDVCLTSEEMKLYKMLNDYRKEKNLPAIPLSRSLCFVAKTHVKDLADNHPDKSNCNMHSWSDKGSWSSCCYTADHKKADCMWDKPKELTNYTSTGYEIAHGGEGGYVATAESSLQGWKKSVMHNNVILNKDKWESLKWKAIGVGINKGYAVIWFGEAADTETIPEICK